MTNTRLSGGLRREPGWIVDRATFAAYAGMQSTLHVKVEPDSLIGSIIRVLLKTAYGGPGCHPVWT